MFRILDTFRHGTYLHARLGVIEGAPEAGEPEDKKTKPLWLARVSSIGTFRRSRYRNTRCR